MTRTHAGEKEESVTTPLQHTAQFQHQRLHFSLAAPHSLPRPLLAAQSPDSAGIASTKWQQGTSLKN